MNIDRDGARLALAGVRLVNGATALLAPTFMLRRLGADPAVNGVAIYPLRMFGIRTVVLAWDLLRCAAPDDPGRRRDLALGVLIHATDALSAFTAGLRRRLPMRVAVLATAISVTNTALAIAAARAPAR